MQPLQSCVKCRVQAGVEDQGFVVTVVGQLEEGSVRVDSAVGVRPEGHVGSIEDALLDDASKAPAATSTGDEVACHSGSCTRE